MSYNKNVIQFKDFSLKEDNPNINTDSLTGLVSMMAFRNTLQGFLDNNQSLTGKAIIYFNIDNFKSFNEKYGYEEGDTFLLLTANVIKEIFYEDIIARFAEDHFVILCEADKALIKITSTQIKVKMLPKGQNIELKAGIYVISSEDKNVSLMYDRARLACNSIKKRYDVDYQYYNLALSNKISKQKYIIDHIEEAISNGNIKVHYQPIIRVLSGKICGVEALSRWQDSEYGFITPDEFISVLEECHLIQKLDIYIVEKVCEDFSFLQRNKLAFVPPSINLSRIDFQVCDIFSIVDDIVSRYKIDKDLFHIEITESAVTNNQQTLQTGIQKFKNAGYQIWMDDFGSGYSSLNTLKDYDFDVLKIDMKFLSSFSTNPKSSIVISSIVDLAKKLGIQTLIEGVETKEELQFLKKIGCEKAQGYLFSKPLNFEDYCNFPLARENIEDIPFFNAIGKTNLLSQNPLNIQSSLTDKVSKTELPGVPVSIIEFKKGKFSFLAVTDSYALVLQSLGLSVEDAIEVMNKRGSDMHGKWLVLIAKCTKSKNREAIDFINNGHHCSIQVRLLAASNASSRAFAVILQNLSQFVTSYRSSSADFMSHVIFSHYNRIDLINEDGNLIETLYQTSSQYDNSARYGYVRENLEQYALQVVHPDDRERFLDFYNFDIIWKELKKKPRISTFFRVRSHNKDYVWQLYSLIPSILNNKKVLLSCSRDVDMKQIEDFMKSQNKL